MIKKKTEYLVVGSGAGGGTVAVELARKGKKVIVLEGGPDLKLIGNHLSAMVLLDKHGFLTSTEGTGVSRALMTGGSSVITCGTSARPPAGLFEEYDIELNDYLEEAERELEITKLPDDIIGEMTLSIMEAGKRLGMNWEKFDKFIDPLKCQPKFCNCMLGCAKGAKWSSRVYLDEAGMLGAEIMTMSRADEVLVSGGKAIGVRGWQKGKGEITVEADCVILAAGGLGTPVICQNSGIYDAGEGFFCDPLAITCGVFPEKRGRGAFEPPMTVGSFDYWESEGFILSPVIDPWLSYGLEMIKAKPSKIWRWAQYQRSAGIMTKAKDELAGRINIDGTFSKQMTHNDRKVLDMGISISRKVLLEAGAIEDSIWVLKARGAHPGGTCRIGEVVNSDLQTSIENLYICDASVIPKSLAAPVVLTLVALGKRLVDKLIPS